MGYVRAGIPRFTPEGAASGPCAGGPKRAGAGEERARPNRPHERAEDLVPIRGRPGREAGELLGRLNGQAELAVARDEDRRGGPPAAEPREHAAEARVVEVGVEHDRGKRARL